MAQMQKCVQTPVQMLMQSFVQSHLQNAMQKVVQSSVQNVVQNSVQTHRGDMFIEDEAQIFPVAPAERPVHFTYRSLRWSYRNRWLAAIYKQVAPMELQRHADSCAVPRAVPCAESRAVLRADFYGELRADVRAVVGAESYAEKFAPMQKSLQK